MLVTQAPELYNYSRAQVTDSLSTVFHPIPVFLPLGLSGRRVLSLPGPVRLSVCLWTFPCRHDNLSHIWARITKFAPNMHLGILSAGIENRGNWLWPSRSFWPFCLRILGNSACPRNNPSQIWAGITKFAPNLHLGILLSVIENRGHSPWLSRSFWPFRLRILGYLACPRNNLKLIWARITKFASNMHLESLLTGSAYWDH